MQLLDPTWLPTDGNIATATAEYLIDEEEGDELAGLMEGMAEDRVMDRMDGDTMESGQTGNPTRNSKDSGINESPTDNSPTSQSPSLTSQESAWVSVKGDDGDLYYWNPKTDETSWNIPDTKHDNDKKHNRKLQIDFTTLTLSKPSPSTYIGIETFDSIPVDLIRRQGTIGKKVFMQNGESTNWKSFWGVLCVGFVVFYKENPDSNNKKVKIQNKKTTNLI